MNKHLDMLLMLLLVVCATLAGIIVSTSVDQKHNTTATDEQQLKNGLFWQTVDRIQDIVTLILMPVAVLLLYFLATRNETHISKGER